MSRTLIAVHAHPDDEALFTGARLALAAAAGIRTVLICLSDGSLGFDPDGRTPLEEGHDRGATAALRSAELHDAATILGVARLVEFRCADSGMEGWPSAQAPTALCNLDLTEVAARLAVLLEEEAPATVVTYAEDGFYGHPDHIATSRIVREAARRVAGDLELEAVVMTPSSIAAALEAAAGSGGRLPEWLGRGLVVPHEEAEVVTATEGSSVARTKQAAVAAHQSQLDNQVLAQMDPVLFAAVFGTEHYIALAR